MEKSGFSNSKYLKTQSQHINERIDQFGGKLYLEFGGKLFDDYHASRVLPGFHPDSKLQLLLTLADRCEIVFAISAKDIEKNKMRGDLGITYDLDVLRLIKEFRDLGLYVSGVVITQFTGQESASFFAKRLGQFGIKTYYHYPISGYPSNINHIVSAEGFGRNDYIETTRPLVVVTAPGPGSGKMATCLSQLYHEQQRGINAGYAKYETFPVWNLPLKHPVNLAYEAATADLDDVNMIDPFHLEAYGVTAVNYNRDIEIFPVLRAMFERIYGESPYKSPTDMGVNMAGNCITDDDVCCRAAGQEIIRRYYTSLCNLAEGLCPEREVDKLELIMNQANVTIRDRAVALAAQTRAAKLNCPCAAFELKDGTIVTGKTSNLFGPMAAALLNSLKLIAGIDHEELVISAQALEPLQKLKTAYLGSKNPRLHTDEALIALSISAATNPNAQKALDALPILSGCQAHCTSMLANVDVKTMKKIKVQLTCDPIFEGNKILY